MSCKNPQAKDRECDHFTVVDVRRPTVSYCFLCRKHIKLK